MSMVEPTKSRPYYMNGKKPANKALSELLQRWDENSAKSTSKDIIGWPPGTVKTVVLAWETILICSMGRIRQSPNVQVRPFTIDVREGGLSLRSRIGCYLLHVKATRDASEEHRQIPPLRSVSQSFAEDGMPMFTEAQVAEAQSFYSDLYKDWLAITSVKHFLEELKFTFRSSSVTFRTLKTLFPADSNGLSEFYARGTRVPDDIHLAQGEEALREPRIR